MKEWIEKYMEECTLCPRKCHVNRRIGEKGYCKQSSRLMAARAALHMWEEPCISGDCGSGAVFFTGCNLGCVFCQNHKIADGSVGKEISVERLGDIFLELQEQNAWNINLVTAAHFVPQVAAALKLAKHKGLSIPVVYNTSGYECVETLHLLEGLVDIYLPDFKYLDAGLAGKYSFAPDYPVVAKAALAEMVRQVGNPQFGERNRKGISVKTGIPEKKCENGEKKSNTEILKESEDDLDDIENLPMKRGVIVRHLVLPGMTEESKDVIQYLFKTYGNQIYISILNQYTPMPGLGSYSELGRKLTGEEYDQVVQFAIDIGVEQGFVQEGGTAKESFIPDFDITGI